MRKELHNEQAKYMSINYGTAVISALHKHIICQHSRRLYLRKQSKFNFDTKNQNLSPGQSIVGGLSFLTYTSRLLEWPSSDPMELVRTLSKGKVRVNLNMLFI